MINKPNRQLPVLVRQICLLFDAYIVGSGAKFISGDTDQNNDWDIIIDPSRFEKFMLFMCDKNFRLNSWGGFKIMDGDIEVDVWPQTLESYIGSPKSSSKIYRPIGGKLITIE